jgi:hypothetical protein
MQHSLKNTTEFIKARFRINASFSLQNNSQDSSILGTNTLIDFSKSIKKVDFNIGGSLRNNGAKYAYKSINGGVSTRFKNLSLSLSLEYFKLNDSLEEAPINKQDMIIKSQLIIKI